MNYSTIVLNSVLLYIIFSIQITSSWHHELSSQPRNEYLVIDTDAGIDDALGLMILIEAASRGEVPEILAITTVVGNTGVENVTRNVLSVLEMENVKIPVYQGAAKGFAGFKESDYYFKSDGFGDILETKPTQEHTVPAAIALVDFVNKFPGKITLMVFGPMTNIAIALSLDNLFLTKLKRMVAMGGSNHGYGVQKPGIEMNVYIDAVSCFYVLQDGIKNENSIIVLPWDPMEQMQVPSEWRTDVLGSLTSKRIQFYNLLETKITLSDHWISSDSVAALLLFVPEIVTKMSHHAVKIIRSDEFEGGFIVDYHDTIENSTKIDIVESLNVDLFKNLMIDYLGAY